MRCARCGSLDDKVVDSRLAKDGTSIRRRRECLKCGRRFTTYETIEQATLSVVKRDGRREEFNREKLFRGVVKACEKRPVSMDVLDQAVDDLMVELQADAVREVPSATIGNMVMAMLRNIDPVAYVRYASVYRQFTAVGEFIDEIQSMEAIAQKKAAEQQELFPPVAR
jgi:transcriptional repressor NrdR